MQPHEKNKTQYHDITLNVSCYNNKLSRFIYHVILMIKFFMLGQQDASMLMDSINLVIKIIVLIIIYLRPVQSISDFN